MTKKPGMTEAEWLVSADRQAMFRVVRARSHSRKCRLFAVACCRAITPPLPDPRSCRAIEVAERHADGLATNEELTRASKQAGDAHAIAVQQWGKEGACLEWGAEFVAWPHPCNAAENVSWAVVNCRKGHEAPDYPAQADFIRDIFGNPFRPVTFEPEWRTSAVIALAEGIYQEGAFDRLPILADALQDAGCQNEDILSHLRGQGPHVKGCWLVDLLIGKS